VKNERERERERGNAPIALGNFIEKTLFTK
jgi:hypothetical protein